ncbi:MAG: hypothetical protein KAU21_02410, partial [Gammaproteobacteria bacterium]|nr:hypothetical protein [Gammaproteobacteria bacterium]
EATPIFNRLSSSNVLTRLQIADKSGSIIYSQPQSFSGKTSKMLVHKAISEKKNFKGIERDDDGKLIAEVTFPLYFRGKPAGAAIFMTSLDDAIKNFKTADGSEIHLISQAGLLEASTSPEQFKLMQVEIDSSGVSRQFKQQIDD